MSRITINESESETLASFDVTENVVLIPIVRTKITNYGGVTNKTVVADGSTVGDSEISLTDAQKLNILAQVGDKFVIARYADTKCETAKADGDYYKLEAASGESEGTIKSYTSISSLQSDYASRVITIGGALDKSYIMAHNLVYKGLTVLVKPINYELTYVAVGTDAKAQPSSTSYSYTIDNEASYRNLIRTEFENGGFSVFESKNIYNIKFITTGGYANYEDDVDTNDSRLSTYISALASARQDAIALIEFPEEPVSIMTDENIINYFAGLSETNEYSAAFFPWCVHSGMSVGDDLTTMPACFSYLMAFAKSVNNNADWFAASGVARGEVPTLKYPTYDVGESLMHIMQGEANATTNAMLSIRINPILDSGAYGYRVWGNRIYKVTSTSSSEASYRDYLNVRILLCDIRKQLFHSSMRIMYEPNDDIAWFNLKALVNPLLEQMKTGRGVEYYLWRKLSTTAKATIRAQLTIKPIEAIEYITIDLNLTDEDLNLEEED